jgi:ankyrin repeat protein
MAELLLAHGADPNQDLGRVMTPFHFAAGSAPLETLKLLHQAGGEINGEPDIEQSYPTPLIWAIDSERIENARFLLEQGADPELTAVGTPTPLAWAVMRANEELIALLLEHGADPDTRFSELSEDCISCPDGITVMHSIVGQYGWLGCDEEKLDRIMQLMIDQGADVNLRNSHGQSPLDFALLSGHARVVGKLLDLGARTDSRSLHNAVRFSHPQCVRLLLELGLDVNVRDGDGNTPLQTCLTCCGDGFGDSIDPGERRETIALLLAHGADPDTGNHDGESFLDLARASIWHMPVIELLVEQGLLQWSDVVTETFYGYQARWVKDGDTSLHSHPSQEAPVLAALAAGTEVHAAHARSTYWPSTGTTEVWFAVSAGDGMSGFVAGEQLQEQPLTEKDQPE